MSGIGVPEFELCLGEMDASMYKDQHTREGTTYQFQLWKVFAYTHMCETSFLKLLL